MNEEFQFRQLHDEELDPAYEIICGAVDWLLSKGIRQWTVPLPHRVWEKRQRDGENYVLVCEGELGVVLSLLREAHPYWKDRLGDDECWWLSTVTTASAFRGRRVGRYAIQEGARFLQDKAVEELYVDCAHGSGFLPRYYESLGFALLARKEIEYPLGTFDMVLMRKEL